MRFLKSILMIATLQTMPKYKRTLKFRYSGTRNYTPQIKKNQRDSNSIGNLILKDENNIFYDENKQQVKKNVQAIIITCQVKFDPLPKVHEQKKKKILFIYNFLENIKRTKAEKTKNNKKNHNKDDPFLQLHCS